MKRLLTVIFQVALFTGAALFGDLLVRLMHVKISGSIVGMILVFLLLQSGILKISWFENGADWLHSRLVLFFVPSAVGISQYGGLLKAEGIPLLLTVAFSTIAVMAITGLCAQALSKKKGVSIHE
jgi:holin-like protein